MGEHDDGVSVAGVSESTVTVDDRPVAADETLMEEPMGVEGSLGVEDGGEIMVEVVGSDVFVDGVGGQGSGGDWNGQEGGGGLVKDGLEREMESVDGEGGVIVGLASQDVGALGCQVLEARIETLNEGIQEIAGSSDEQTHVAAEEVAPRVNEEGLERGEQLDGRGDDASGVLGSHRASTLHDEAQNSEIETGVGGSLAISGSSCEQSEFVAERVVAMATEESLERGLVEEREMESVDGKGGVIGGLASQEVGALGVQVLEARIEARIEGFQETAGSSDELTHVVAEEVAPRVNEEGLEKGDQLDGRGDDASGVLGSHRASTFRDEAQNSEIETGVGGSLAISGSSCEQSEFVSERVVAMATEESLERRLVEEREMESVDGKGGVIGGLASQEVGALGGQVLEARIEARIEGFQEIAVSSDELTHVVEEEVALRVNEEGLEKGEQLDGRGDDASGVLGSHRASTFHDEAQNSEIESGVGGSLAISGSSCEQSEVVAETVVAMAIEESLERGLVEEREMESVDSKGGVIGGLALQEVGALGGQVLEARIEARIEGFQEIAGSSDELTHVVVEEVAPRVNEEGLERSEQLDGRGGDATGVLGSHRASILHDEAKNSEIEDGMGGSLAISGLSCEQSEVVVATASEESLERGLVEEGVEKYMKSVEGRGDAPDVFLPQRGSVLDDELWNPGIGAAVVCSSTVAQSSSMPMSIVAEEVTALVDNEFLNLKDEVPGVGVDEGNLNCSENNQSTVAETVCVGRDKDGAIHSNAESLNQQVEVDIGGEVGVMNKEEILHPEGNLCCSVEDQEMKVETAGENTESQVDLHTGFISSCDPTMAVAASEVTTVDDEVALNPNVGTPNNVVLGRVGVDSGEVGIVCADFGSSIEQSQVSADYSVANDSKISISSTATLAGGGREPLTTENRVLGDFDENLDYVEDQELKVNSVGGGSERDAAVCTELQSCYKETKVVSGNEVSVMDSKVSNSELEIPTTDDMDRTVACSENDQNMKCEATCGIAGKDGHVLADLESNEQAFVTEIGEVAAMDVEEVLNIEGEVAGDDAFNVSCSGKDQYLEVKKVDGSCESDVVHRDLESSGKQTQIADISNIVMTGKGVPKLEDEAMMKNGEKVSNFKIEVLDGDTCLQKNEELNTLTVIGSMEQDGIAQGNAETSGDQIKIDNPVESSVLNCQGIVQVPACFTDDENISLSEKAEVLKVETLSKTSVEDPSEGVDAPPIEEHSSSIQTCSDSLDGKQEIVAELADIQTHEVDGNQSMNMLIVDESLAEGVCSAALLNTVIEGTAACQAAFTCASTHNGSDPVSSSVSDFMGLLPDEHKNLEVHTVSSDISVLNGNQAIVTSISGAVNSDEVVNPEAKGEFYKADEHPEGQVLNNSMVGSLVVDLDNYLNKDGKWKPQDEAVKENISLPDESQFMRDDVQATGGNVGHEFSESLDGSATGDLCLDDSGVRQEVEVQEQCTASEQVDPYEGQEIATGEHAVDHEQEKCVEDKSSKQTTLKSGSSAKAHQQNYLLPPENEGEFSVSDLIWGKVRSHPWWPGQIFNPAAASEKAMKYHKKDCFLVAYFGDRTFAWNDASLLKPFWTNFSQIEKQSNSETFQNAVSCALEEVSRRVELGLACSCIPKDAYDKIESQIVENTGICEESSRRYGVDKSTGVNCFEPANLVEYIRALAQSPSAGADRLELLVAKAQLLAFSRLKGFCQLPEFQFCGGLLENNADCSQLGEVIDHAPNGEQIVSSKGRLKNEKSSSHKRKHNLKDIVYPKKKERSLSELMGDGASSPDGEDGSDWKASSKSVSSSSGKKRKAVDFISDASEVQDRRISFYAAKVSTTASPIPKPSFKVGECIRRVASQLTGSPSILKSSSGKFQKVDVSSDVPVGFDLRTPDNSQGGRMIFPMAYSSLDEMLSQLHLAAEDPMKGYSFLTTIITFFSGFRNSISFGHYTGRQNSSTGKLGGGRKKKASHGIIGSPEEFEFDDVNDSYWTDRIIQNNSEEQQPSGDSQNREGEYQLMAFDPDKSMKSSRRSYSRKRYSNGNHEMAMEEPIEYIDERKKDNSPTELILNFSEGDYIPSEVNLNKIFRRFGPLKESETEVDPETSRARVVFKKCSDAEVAFSSAGKFNIFGQMIVNYQLSYSPSISFKTLPLETSQGQEDAT